MSAVLLLFFFLNAQSSLGAEENAYQQFIGCTFSSKGQAGHFWRYGYNGKDMMHIDLSRETMVSTSEDGRFLTEERKSVEYIKKKENRLMKLCSAVQTVFSLSNNSLSRAVKPTVHVRIGKENGQEFLICLVHGFYPNVIHVQWIHDGKPVYYGTSKTGILPHKDGTFQMTSYFSFGNTSIHGVSCQVEHISIDGKLKATLEKKSVHPLSVVIAMAVFLAGFAFPVGVTIMIIYFKRKKRPNSPEHTTNDSSEMSETPPSVSLMQLPAEL